MKNYSILIVGVGGQGTLLTSKLLGNAAMLCGMDVKVSEVHGMAQRGGSVVTYVRMGEGILSPLVEEGGADILLSFEEAETLRYISYVKHGGSVILNTQQIYPVSVLSGQSTYPTSIINELSALDITLECIDAATMALEAGSIRTANVVMTGVLSRGTDIPEETWLKAIELSVPEKTIDMNKKAFLLGRQCEDKL